MSFLRLHPELLLRFRAGERDALAAVYRAYLPRLQGLLRRGFFVRAQAVHVPGVRDADDLADTLQEVFARAFKAEARAAYDPRRDYWPYLSVIARNVIVSRHRRAGRELLGVDIAELSDPEIVEGGEPETPWLDPRSLEIAKSYVATLPESMRAVHAARYVDALSQRDAAKQLGLSRPKVRKLEDKLRRELLKLLERAGLCEHEPIVANADTPSEMDEWTARPRTS